MRKVCTGSEDSPSHQRATPRREAFQELQKRYRRHHLQWVHHPHNHPLVITTTIGNMNVHQTLVDNGSSVDILYLGAYEQMGLGLHQFTPTPTHLYGFTGDSLTPVGSIKLAMTVGTYPRISIVMANFLVVDCPLAFNAVSGRPTLKELRVVTSTHDLLMKFPMSNRVGQV